MVTVVVLLTTVLMFLAFGSLVLPVKAALMSALGLGATLGILTWIFIDGHGAGLLHFTPGPIMSPVLVLIIAIIYGLSTDYEVFLLSRMVEARAQGASTTESIRIGTAHTGRIITAAALILIVVTGAFGFSELVMMKYIAFGMIAALILDATVIRMFLVPATMKLLGDDCWWAPAWMKRIQERIGLAEPILEDELMPRDVPELITVGMFGPATVAATGSHRFPPMTPGMGPSDMTQPMPKIAPPRSSAQQRRAREFPPAPRRPSPSRAGRVPVAAPDRSLRPDVRNPRQPPTAHNQQPAPPQREPAAPPQREPAAPPQREHPGPRDGNASVQRTPQPTAPPRNDSAPVRRDQASLQHNAQAPSNPPVRPTPPVPPQPGQPRQASPLPQRPVAEPPLPQRPVANPQSPPPRRIPDAPPPPADPQSPTAVPQWPPTTVAPQPATALPQISATVVPPLPRRDVPGSAPAPDPQSPTAVPSLPRRQRGTVPPPLPHPFVRPQTPERPPPGPTPRSDAVRARDPQAIENWLSQLRRTAPGVEQPRPAPDPAPAPRDQDPQLGRYRDPNPERSGPTTGRHDDNAGGISVSELIARQRRQ
jgi:RND superfamily putative drug exporter